MFNLILVIVSLAIAGILAVAMLYFGGESYNAGRADADAARYINESQQIVGAIRVYETDQRGTLPRSLQELVDGDYLTAIPQAGENWDMSTDSIVRRVANKATCHQVNIRAGIYSADDEDKAPPRCDSEDLDDVNASYLCCVEDEPEA